MIQKNDFLDLLNEIKKDNVGAKLFTSTGTHIILFQPLMFISRVIPHNDYIKRLSFKLRSTSLDNSFTTIEDTENLNIPSYIFVDAQTTNKLDAFLEAYQKWVDSLDLITLGKENKCTFEPLTKKEITTDYLRSVFFPDSKFGVPLKEMDKFFVKIYQTTSWDKLVCNDTFLSLSEDIASLDVKEDRSGNLRYIDKTGWKKNIFLRLDDIRQIDAISAKMFPNYWITNKEHINIIDEIKQGKL